MMSALCAKADIARYAWRPKRRNLETVRLHNAQLTAAKVSNPRFEEKCGNSPDISKGIPELGMFKFESSQVSQAVLRLATVCNLRLIGPEIPAFSRSTLSPDSCSPNLGPEIAESLRLCPRKFPFCRDFRRRPVRSGLPPESGSCWSGECLVIRSQPPFCAARKRTSS
jgi:hypothetical protein